jgi:hypothetical protein
MWDVVVKNEAVLIETGGRKMKDIITDILY